MKYLGPIVLISVVAIIARLFADSKILEVMLNLAWLGALGWYIHAAFSYNSKTWPALYGAWERTFLCTRCDHRFEP